MTRADAGLPGRENIGVFPPLEGSLFGIVANVVGLPGFILTLPKCIVPSKLRSITGFSKSPGPMDVPPVVKIKSAVSRPSWIFEVWSWTLNNGEASEEPG